SGFTLPDNETQEYLPTYDVTIGRCPDGHSLHAVIDFGLFTPIILDFFLFGLAMLVAGYFSQCLWVLTGENQTRKIRELYLQAILRQDMGWFDKAEEGSLTTRLAQDTQLIQEGISEKFGSVVMSGAQFIAGFVIAFVKGWKLAVIVLVSFPLMALVGFIMIRVIVARVRQGQDAYAMAGAVAEQVIAGIRTVYAFNLQSRFQDKYDERLEAAEKADVSKGFALGIGFGAFLCIVYLTNALAFYYGSTLVVNGSFAVADVLVVFFSMLMGTFAVIAIPNNLAAVSSARGAALKIYTTIDRLPTIDPYSDDGIKANDVVGNIEFKNVKFNYPSRADVPILHDFSLKVHSGQTVAFVGSSGSGKSTCVGLIQRFYDAIDGEVLFDGHNIKDYNLKWLRSQIGVVSQEPVLFNLTIKQNILLGATSEVTEDDLINVCKMANCHTFITSLPKGYDTMVGEHGGMMSGGQKQRIAIARALIRNPKVLLLDEATSALDTQSERIVQRALDVAAADRTTIVIAHRLSTIRNADLIVVMSNGRIIETGKHDELIARGGVYHELVEKQKLKSANDAKLTGGEAEVVEEYGHISDAELQKELAAEAKELETAKQDYAVVDVTDGDGDNQRLWTLDRQEMKAMAAARSKAAALKDKETKNSQKAPVWRVLKLMRPEWHFLGVGLLGAGMAGAVGPIMAYTLTRSLVGLYADQVAGSLPGAFQGTNLYAFVFVVLAIGVLIGFSMQILSFESAGSAMTRRLRNMAFASIMRQEGGFFDHEGNSLGALTTALATDASSVGDMVTKVWGDVGQLVCTALAGLIIAFYYGWALTLICLCAVPFLVVSTYYEARVRKGFEDATKKAYAESGEVAAEAIKEIRTVAALNRQPYFQDRFWAENERPHQLALNKAYTSSLGNGVNQAIVQWLNALGFYAGLQLSNICVTEFSNVFTVIMAVMITSQGIGRASTFLGTFSKAKIAAIKTFELIDRQTEIDPDQSGVIPSDMDGNFEFKDISFTYPARPDQPVFDGLMNLSGKKNQTIALVGPSGSGKSTTIGMLERFYDNSGGSVTIDGTEVKQMDMKKGLRANLALVSQEPTLFDMTIRENILAGSDRTDVTDAELDEVARMANIHEFVVGLPNNYDTRVGDKGGQLSGGQKQRVAIARALIRNPRILLLDEATSALDSESEKLVQQAIDAAIEAGGRTTITIAHRLSTIQNADQIAVLRDGRVVELGTHFELLALNGVYAALVKDQNLNALA
ncbi:ATP-binding cassette, sub-B (MDR TAP), member 4, partial [Cladochytrium tenue]